MHAVFDPLVYELMAFRTCSGDIQWVQRRAAVGGKVDTVSAVTIGANGRYAQAGFKKAFSVHRGAICLLIFWMARTARADLVTQMN
jgi:hypothetical protein